MSVHEQFAENLALYALNALEGDDRAVLEKHLATCSECRLELEQLRGDGALLALSTVGPKPPARARQKLLDAVAKEAAESPTLRQAQGRLSRSQNAREMGHPSVAPRRSWWGALGWAATVAVIVFAASLWKENTALKQSLASASAQAVQSTRELDNLRRIAAPIIAPEAQHFTLVTVKTPPQPQGKAFYLRKRSSLVFVANNMPSLPPHKAYELWLIPAQGVPVAAGVFKPDAHGSATVVNPPLPAGIEAKGFAITVEDEAGVEHSTQPVMMIGTGE
ncbi:MAG TPA: anti-sigma factor, partial [Candidatus Sulfotelmatobacter sp.]|nr:anti-sigma factor [Candidatus Sulfotelmatobacter sp.]